MDQPQPAPMTPPVAPPVSPGQGGKTPAVAPWLLWTFIVVVVLGGGYLIWFFMK